MLVVLLLLVFTVCVVWFGPRIAASAAWPSAEPRLGLLLCQAVPAAVAGGVVLMAGMTLVSVQHVRPDLEHLLHACAVVVWDNATHPGVPLTSALGIVAALVLTHLLRTATASSTRVRRVRREQHEALALVGEADARYTRVHSDQVFAYCLPGHGGRIVISTAAESELDDMQLAAVLAHERAHLRGRHHVLVQVTHVLARAIPLPPLRLLHLQARTLVEMAADDRACRATSREALIGALLQLNGRVTGPGLTAKGAGAGARALRLVEPARAQSACLRFAVSSGALTLLLTPWLIGALPVVLALTGHCQDAAQPSASA